MAEPTPGQVAHTAYVRAGYPDMTEHVVDLWLTLRPDLKRAWEAAAKAVLALRDTREEETHG